MKLMSFTLNDIFFMIIIFILYFLTNFNLVEGNKGKKKKQKAKIKKLEKKERKGNLNANQQAKLDGLRRKVEQRKRKKKEKKDQRKKRREEKKKRKQIEDAEKQRQKELEKNIDDSGLERHMFNNDILTRLRASKEQEIQAERSDLLNSMTTKNYWELVFGDFNSWKQKYVGIPGVEKPVVKNKDFDPFSFMLNLDPMEADFTNSYSSELIPDLGIEISSKKPEIDKISGEPLPDGPAMPGLSML